MKKTAEWAFKADEIGVIKLPSTEVIKGLLRDFRTYAQHNEKTARLAVDLETTSLDPYLGIVTLVVLTFTGRAVAVCRPEDMPWEEFNAVMADPSLTKVFHNGKFDMKWLKLHFSVPDRLAKRQIELTDFRACDDTMIMRQMLTMGLEQNTMALPADLKTVAEKYLSFSMNKETRDDFIGNATITDEMIVYAAIDGAVTWALQPLMIKEIYENGLDLCYFNIERDLVQVVAEMELWGIAVDLEVLKEYREKLEKKQLEFQARLDDLLISVQAMPTKKKKITKKEMKERGIMPTVDIQKDGKTLRIPNPEYNKDHFDHIEVDSFNVNSPAQCVKVLNAIGFDVEKSSKDVLETPYYTQVSLHAAKKNGPNPKEDDRATLERGFAIIEYLRNLRSASKQLTSFIIPLQTLKPSDEPKGVSKAERKAHFAGKFLHPKTGRVHGEFKQVGTNTGRFAHAYPNTANQPSPKELVPCPTGARDIDGKPLMVPDPFDIYDGLPFRRIFVTGEGRKGVYFDYSSCELLILAQLTQDPGLIKAAHAKDFHYANAALAFGIPIEEVTKNQRKGIKTTTFCYVYGGGQRKISTILRIPIEQAADLVSRFKTKFGGMQRWGSATQAHAVEHGWIQSMSGRRRLFDLPPVPKYDPNVDRSAEEYAQLVRDYKWKKARVQRQAQNMPVQGTNADITKLAMVWLRDELKPLDTFINISVHDEIGCDAPEEHAEAVYKIMHDTMIAAEREFLTEVPCKVDGKIADYWEK